jgi:hypothetical protein
MLRLTSQSDETQIAAGQAGKEVGIPSNSFLASWNSGMVSAIADKVSATRDCGDEG